MLVAGLSAPATGGWELAGGFWATDAVARHRQTGRTHLYQAGERRGFFGQEPETRPSGAKARDDSAGFIAGLKSRPTVRRGFSSARKALVESEALVAPLKRGQFEAVRSPAVCFPSIECCLIIGSLSTPGFCTQRCRPVAGNPERWATAPLRLRQLHLSSKAIIRMRSGAMLRPENCARSRGNAAPND